MKQPCNGCGKLILAGGMYLMCWRCSFFETFQRARRPGIAALLVAALTVLVLYGS